MKRDSSTFFENAIGNDISSFRKLILLIRGEGYHDGRDFGGFGLRDVSDPVASAIFSRLFRDAFARVSNATNFGPDTWRLGGTRQGESRRVRYSRRGADSCKMMEHVSL